MAAERTVAEVMSTNPLTVEATDTAAVVAGRMRDGDVGAVLVVDGGRLAGIVTDRDITVRIVAEGTDPNATPIRDACSSGDLATVTPDTALSQAVRLMREKAVRRLPVTEGDKAVGILSIGDLAIEQDPGSALADISAAPGND